MTMELSAPMTMDAAVEELMRTHRSLPPRPGIEEVVAAKSLIQNVEREDQIKLDGIEKQSKGKDVPEEMFMILQEMQRNMIHLQSKEQKKEAQKVLDLEGVHLVFDELIQRASECIKSYAVSQKSRSVNSTSGSNSNSKSNSVVAATSKPLLSSGFYNEESTKALSTKDDMFLKKSKSSFHVDGVRSGDVFDGPQIVDSSLKPATTSGQDSDKLSLIKLASRIEVLARKGTPELILQGKLSDQIEWLPDSIGKLTSLITLDLSENKIVMLPDSIGGLSSLKTLSLNGNKIHELPESIGGLVNLLCLDLRGNELTTLPPAIGKLVRLQELDLSSNGLAALPETIGSLVSLQKLSVETNDIEEIPHTIGRCTSLKEFHADYNRLKALPEAVGRIESLEILTVRYNNIKQLPTTMASLSSLRQLDVSFNELESIPESLCLATTLVKMDVSNNFADLQSLPRSLGNLEMLEELMSNNNQIRVLPDSFGMLTRLRVLDIEGNPLVVPPRDVVEKGAQAVVRYMADLGAKRDVKSQPAKQKKSWVQILFFSKSNKRKRSGTEYAKA
ncbi:Ras suppressor protein (contains leucine-rich repeats) [Handroanthus impetiginosus]|uniref:Ras suppressor protein (Contains leucine-rich repeats) n=1 Tax=Handroanthus impetiginosus TaxID=429701 RepID=A0A2G9GEP9_9LAMI|nr:Ras suppressor protein (contains leucine-rich repeats) [Handroanthus impetiginosus]